jgi:RNA polymerase sigma factor (sigma-70 family)
MSPPSLRHPARLAGASLLRLQSDERLAALAADGHEAAFDAIVDRYRTPLTRYCAGIVGPSRAEDAVQQALINAHDALQRTDEVRHLRSWLYRIAHNASLNVLRAVRDDMSLGAASDTTAAAEDGPAAAFERSERFQATVDALRDLPERQRAALVLRELEGRSHEEIAETLGVTKGSARQHLMRARVALRSAVTAITPYPLVVRLAEMIASPGAAGWTDAAVGTGAGATLAKLTAGVAATGALVGGAVGTERVVHHHHRDSAPKAAERSSSESPPRRAVKARVVSLPEASVAATGSSAVGSARSSGADRVKSKDKRKPGRSDDHDRSHDRSSGHGSGGSGHNGRNDNSGSGSGSRGRGGHSGAAGGSGHGSGGNDDSSGSGRHGSGGEDGNGGKRHGSAERGSSGSADGSRRSDSSGSGSSGSGGDSGSSTLGHSRKGPDDNSGSGSGSGRDGDDHFVAPTTTAAPVTETTTPAIGSGSSSGSGDSERSGSDGDSGSSDRSGSSDGSGSG